MFNYQSLRQNTISSYKPSISLPNQFNDYMGNEISLRRNLLEKKRENISNISFGDNTKTRNEYSHSPFCIFNSEIKSSSPTMMNIRMNFDLLNHKIERLNKLLTESNSNISNSLNKQIIRPNSTNKFYKNTFNLKSPEFLNTITTNASIDNLSRNFNNNSPFKNSYSFRYSTTTNRNNEVSSNDLNEHNLENLSINNSSNNINNNSIYSKEKLSVNSINNLLTPPKNKNIDNYTYKNPKFTNYINNNNIKNTIKINIKTRNDIKNEIPESNKTKAKLLTKNDISEMINNLHEKTKSFLNHHQIGIDRYKSLKLNKKLNNFNRGVISGNLNNIRNSFDMRGNRAINYIRDYLNNKEIAFKYNNQSPIKNVQLNYNNINYSIDNNNNNINKNNYCSTSSCKKCKRKQPERKIYSYGNKNEFDKKIMDILSFQKNYKPIQIKENNNYQKKNYNYKKGNYNIKDLIKEFKEKKNEKNTLNIDKAIDNFGGLVNIENSGIKENYYDQNNIKNNFQPKRVEVDKIFEEIKNSNQGY